MEGKTEGKAERSRKEILSDNINGYLRANHMTQKQAAIAAGIKPTTLNNWILGKAQPRDDNLQQLADLFRIRIEDLTEDRSEAGYRRKNFMPIVEIEILKAYEGDPEFRTYVDQGMAARRAHRLKAANRVLEDMLEHKKKRG